MSVQTSYSNDFAVAYNGQLVRASDGGIMSGVSADSADIPFGRAVAWDPSAPASDMDMTLPANATDKIVGIVLRSHAYGIYPYGDLDVDTGVKPGGILNVLTVGELWVVCEDGCVPGDRLWVRRTAAGDPEFLGGLNSADDSTDTIDCTAQGLWLTTATAGGLARLRVNFTSKQTDAA
jgi:hypothetical protein